MTEKNTIVSYSMDEIKAMRAAGLSQTRPDAPEAEPEGDAFWARAVVVTPKDRKASIHLRVDPDVLAWYRAQGEGHLTRMNAVLRLYFEAHREPLIRSRIYDGCIG